MGRIARSRHFRGPTPVVRFREPLQNYYPARYTRVDLRYTNASTLSHLHPQHTAVAMGRPKRQVLATIEDTITPPDALPDAHFVARIVKAEGKNLYSAELPNGKSVLAELEAKFRSTVWIKRGSYVVVDTSALAERDNKLDGEIVNVVRDEKAWRKMSYWCV